MTVNGSLPEALPGLLMRESAVNLSSAGHLGHTALAELQAAFWAADDLRFDALENEPDMAVVDATTLAAQRAGELWREELGLARDAEFDATYA